jgi:hemolysin activation/secretion protein
LSRIALAAALCCALPALAQLPPVDAGSQLRDAQKKPPALPRKPPPRLQPEPPPRPAGATLSVRFVLKDLQITGNSVFSTDELKSVAGDVIGHEVGFADLEQAAARITRHYRSRGYLVARAYLPAQTVLGGMVEIAVLEGRLSAIEVKNGTRVRDSVIEGHFGALMGEVIEEQRLERKLLLLSDLPGLGAAGAALRPGERVGESALGLEVAKPDAPLASLELDNYGSYFTGEARLAAALDIASPTGSGDLLSARLTKGVPGLELASLSYQLPLGRDGLRAGVSYSTLAYRLGKEFESLDAEGRAESAGATLAYPLVRRLALNVSVLAVFTRREFEDRVKSTSTVTEKATDAATLGVSGDWRDALAGGAVNVWSLAYSGGKLTIETPAAQAIDDATLRTRGSYEKLGWNLMRAQRLGERWSALLTLSGQLANKNLDSSEKFTLGGPYGVRAFPLGEAAGDEGVLGSAELRFELAPAVLQALAFADLGEVTINHDPPAASAENERALGALGAGLNWTQRRFSARGIVAWGSERALSAPHRDPRVWLQLALRL